MFCVLFNRHHFPDLYVYFQGEFPYPEPSKWTDAELGIPPDDYEE